MTKGNSRVILIIHKQDYQGKVMSRSYVTLLEDSDASKLNNLTGGKDYLLMGVSKDYFIIKDNHKN